MVSFYLCLCFGDLVGWVHVLMHEWVYKWFLFARFLNFKLSKAALLIKQRFAALYGEICALMESCAALQENQKSKSEFWNWE